MKTRLIYFLYLILAISCTKASSSSLKLDVVTGINNEATGTKAIVIGDNFVSGNTFGLFVYYAENQTGPLQQYRSYGDMYSNIKAQKGTQGEWTYTLNGSSSLIDGFFVLEPSVEGLSAVAVCAYAPYSAAATSINKIPFSIGGKYSKIIDLMWATQNYDSDNLYIEPKGDKETVYLTFKHALAMLEFGFKCDHPDTEMQVTSIKIKKAGATKLYSDGFFDAVNAEFFSFTEADEVVFDFTSEGRVYSFDDTQYLYLPVLIIPQKYLADGDYVIEFTFNNQTLPVTYPIPKEYLTEYIIENEDGTKESIRAFVQGKVYTFEFDFNNYAQIRNVNVNESDVWPAEVYSMEF